jgi:hypothetical protein
LNILASETTSLATLVTMTLDRDQHGHGSSALYPRSPYYDFALSVSIFKGRDYVN